MKLVVAFLCRFVLWCCCQSNGSEKQQYLHTTHPDCGVCVYLCLCLPVFTRVRVGQVWQFFYGMRRGKHFPVPRVGSAQSVINRIVVITTRKHRSGDTFPRTIHPTITSDNHIGDYHCTETCRCVFLWKSNSIPNNSDLFHQYFYFARNNYYCHTYNITSNDRPFGCPIIYTDTIDNAIMFTDIFINTWHN